MTVWKKKSFWAGILLLLVLGAAAIRIIRRELNGQDLPALLRQADRGLLLLCLVCMAVYAVCDAWNISRCLRLSGDRIRPVQALRYAFAGFFFSSVTPSSTGGQPAQLYDMGRDGIPLSHGAFALLCALLSYQAVSVVFGLFGAVFSPISLFSLPGHLSWLFLLGFGINLLLVFFLFSILFSRKLSAFFASLGLRLIRHFPRFSSSRGSVLRFFASYRRVARLMKQHPDVFRRMLLTTGVQLLLYHSIPFLCCRALGIGDLQWFPCFCTQALLFISVSSLPFPGAAGITEYGYTLFYARLIPKGMIGSALLLSRCFSFVIPLAVSGLCLLLPYRPAAAVPACIRKPEMMFRPAPAGPAGAGLFCQRLRMSVFIRRLWSRMLLRRRRFFGVTSRSSSSARNSRHCSRLRMRGGTSRRASSEPEARVLVRCLVRQTLTGTSSAFGQTPTTIPP